MATCDRWANLFMNHNVTHGTHSVSQSQSLHMAARADMDSRNSGLSHRAERSDEARAKAEPAHNNAASNAPIGALSALSKVKVPSRAVPREDEARIATRRVARVGHRNRRHQPAQDMANAAPKQSTHLVYGILTIERRYSSSVTQGVTQHGTGASRPRTVARASGRARTGQTATGAQ